MELSPASQWRKFEIAPLGVDPAIFSPHLISDPADGFEIISVGRLVPAKGQHILIAAVDRLVKAGRNLRLRIVGSGPDRESLEREVARRALCNHVIFEGAVNQDHIRELYGEADAFVLASFAEGVPVVLMEAMAMEIACVATSIAGIPELIRNGVDGLAGRAVRRARAGGNYRGPDQRSGDAPPLGHRRTQSSDREVQFERQCRAPRAHLYQSPGNSRRRSSMRKLTGLVIGAGLIFGVVVAIGTRRGELTAVALGAPATLSVSATPAIVNVRRIGVDLGSWTYYGAEQFSSNILMNPGFEPNIDRAIVIVHDTSAAGFSDDSSWLGRPNNFWSGATFQVRTGQSAGYFGTIASSLQTASDGLPWFSTTNPAPTLAPGDVISVLTHAKFWRACELVGSGIVHRLCRDQHQRPSAGQSRTFGRADDPSERSADRD